MAYREKMTEGQINTKEWADLFDPGKKPDGNSVKNQNETFNIRKQSLGPNTKR